MELRKQLTSLPVRFRKQEIRRSFHNCSQKKSCDEELDTLVSCDQLRSAFDRRPRTQPFCMGANLAGSVLIMRAASLGNIASTLMQELEHRSPGQPPTEIAHYLSSRQPLFQQLGLALGEPCYAQRHQGIIDPSMVLRRCVGCSSGRQSFLALPVQPGVMLVPIVRQWPRQP